MAKVCDKINYSRDSLLKLNRPYRLPTATWQRLKELQLNAVRPTRRAGRRCRKRHFKIPVIISNRLNLDTSHYHNCNVINNNLVQIKSNNHKQCLDVHCWNARSLNEKSIFVHDYLLDKDIDILVITETWLGVEDPVIIGECTPSGYVFFNCPRPGDRHGGIAIICKSALKLSISQSSIDVVTFEHLSITDNSKSFRLTAIYRPPPSDENQFNYHQFLEEFDEFLNHLSDFPGKPIIMGDLNVHVNKPEDNDVGKYLTCISEHGFQQYVRGVTHKRGNTLDHVICHPEDDLLSLCEVSPFRYGSDHHMIQCTLNMVKPPPDRRLVTSRSYKNMDMSAFSSDLANASKRILNIDDPNIQAEQYNIVIRNVLDKHCPEKTRSYKVIRNPKWYTDEVRDARRKRRQLERKWRKTCNNEDHDKFIVQNTRVKQLIVESKISHFKERLENADSKNMFRTLNSLLNFSARKLPACSSNSTLSDNFACFFSNKVSDIRKKLDDESCNVQYNVSYNEQMCNSDFQCCFNDVDSKLDYLSFVTEEEVRNIISKLNNKNSPQDPIPTWLLKQNIDILLPVITSIINKSFKAGCFPQILRHAVISPIIKKSSLNPDILKNCRPVSNLPTLGKIIEYPAISRFNSHLHNNNLSEIFQSAYKPSHSTETALLKVKTDILNELDKGNAIALVLLDLSAEFDTIDHTIFGERMQRELGILGKARNWFDSYLSDRSSRVCVLGEFSGSHPLKFGVPQGSVAGPSIFSAYAQSVADIIKSYDIFYHLYADDIQLYTSFDPSSEDSMFQAERLLTTCIADIRSWMCVNKLMLNDSKTELFMISSPWYFNDVSNFSLKIGGSVIKPSQSIRNLGVMFDCSISMNDHVSFLCKTVNFYLRCLRKIRRYIDRTTCAHAVRSLILSRLDYCNSLLAGLSVTDIRRLQKLQNRAARLIYQVNRRTSAPPLLRELHWLPVQQRIEFKTLVHVYNCLSGSSPVYLQKLISKYTGGRPGLRSSVDHTRLVIQRTRKSYGDRSFSVIGPRLWNDLPRNIREAPNLKCFKKQLKTYLFPNV